MKTKQDPARVNAFVLLNSKESVNIDFYVSYITPLNPNTGSCQETIQIEITVYEDLSAHYLVMSTQEDLINKNVYLLPSGVEPKFDEDYDTVMEEVEKRIESFFKNRHNLTVKTDGLCNIDRIITNKSSYSMESHEIFWRFFMSQTKIKISESCYYD